MALTLLLLGPLAGCVSVGALREDQVVVFESTFRRVLARAEGGDAESQNAAGFMLYLGEGVGADRAQARLWFERAAAAGNARARRNLAAIAALPSYQPDRSKQRAAAVPGHARGETHYARYCGGCHGVNGVAAYENSPSFAFGERLDKSDAALMRSLLDGSQEMPGWDGKLPQSDLREILSFVRTLPARYDEGVAAELRSAPAYMYLFGRMEERRLHAPPGAAR